MGRELVTALVDESAHQGYHSAAKHIYGPKGTVKKLLEDIGLQLNSQMSRKVGTSDTSSIRLTLPIIAEKSAEKRPKAKAQVNVGVANEGG